MNAPIPPTPTTRALSPQSSALSTPSAPALPRSGASRVGARVGGWIQTASGRQFWPLDPRIEDVHPPDIIDHLSKICRFAGACRKFYSVAQHSVLVSEIVQEIGREPDCSGGGAGGGGGSGAGGFSPMQRLQAALVGLWHDAAEAYIGDITRPFKRHLYACEAEGLLPGDAVVRQSVRELEARVQAAIEAKLDLWFELDRIADIHTLVKRADGIALAMEARQLMVWPPPQKWIDLAETDSECRSGLPALQAIHPLPPLGARDQFQRRLDGLQQAIANQRAIEAARAAREQEQPPPPPPG